MPLKWATNRLTLSSWVSGRVSLALRPILTASCFPMGGGVRFGTTAIFIVMARFLIDRGFDARGASHQGSQRDRRRPRSRCSKHQRPRDPHPRAVRRYIRESKVRLVLPNCASAPSLCIKLVVLNIVQTPQKHADGKETEGEGARWQLGDELLQYVFPQSLSA
jgi:hypothetical protein